MVAIADTMRNMFRKEYDKRPVSTLFLTIIIIFFIIFVAAAIVSGGSTFNNMLNSPGSNVFMDHFDSVLYSSDHPYTKYGVIYPPLATVLYAALGRFIIPYVNVPAGTGLTAELIRDSQMGMLSFVLITLLTFFALYLVYSRSMKDKDIRKELLFLFAIVLTFPFIYAIERGNSIILVIVFCLIFLAGYRSENKWIRYMAYASLGCATGFKLYPAILWLLTLRDRRYKEAGICALIVAALILIPFLFTDGGPIVLLDAIFRHVPTSVGFTNIGQIVHGTFGDFLGLSENMVSAINYAVLGGFTLLSFIVILFDREMKFWKVVALISCNLVLGPGVGVPYQLVYMWLPILYFLASEKHMSRENAFYTVCFAMIFVLIPGIGGTGSVFVIIVAAAILYEGIARICRRNKHQCAEAA